MIFCEDFGEHGENQNMEDLNVCAHYITDTFYYAAVAEKRKGTAEEFIPLSFPDLGGHDHQTITSHHDQYPYFAPANA